MKFLVSQLYLLTLLALPFISSSCNDDDEPKAEITSLGIEDGATVKTFYREEGVIRLQPENDAMEPFILEDVTILGKVVAVMRFFR